MPFGDRGSESLDSPERTTGNAAGHTILAWLRGLNSSMVTGLAAAISFWGESPAGPASEAPRSRDRAQPYLPGQSASDPSRSSSVGTGQTSMPSLVTRSRRPPCTRIRRTRPSRSCIARSPDR